MNEELQVENGSYTRIVNKVIDELVKTPLLGTELAVCLFILRKTWGFNKKQDEISLTQFEQALKRSRPTIAKALKNLQLVNMVKLVSKGNSKESSNCWAFNKYSDTWKVVKGSKLVKFSYATSKENIKQLVKGSKHTKDIIKDNTKDIAKQSFAGKEINTLLGLFEVVNPTINFGNLTQRSALERMLKRFGFEKLEATIKALPEVINKPYAPKITTPIQLENKLGELIAFYKQEQGKKINNKVAFI